MSGRYGFSITATHSSGSGRAGRYGSPSARGGGFAAPTGSDRPAATEPGGVGLADPDGADAGFVVAQAFATSARPTTIRVGMRTVIGISSSGCSGPGGTTLTRGR